MRLIDADALLEELKKTGRYFQAKFDIENAPTIKEMPEKYIIQVKTKEDAQKIKNVWDKNNFGNVIITSDNLDIIPIRPQGEWLYPLYDTVIGKRRRGKAEKQCSVCKQIFSNNLPWNARFCPSCGADNGGKEK